MAGDYDAPFSADDFTGFPRIGDTAFHGVLAEGDPRWAFNARIERRPPMENFIHGYRETVDVLFAAIQAWAGSGMIDRFVYPYVYLWRHYLELRLKELVVSYWALVEVDSRADENLWVYDDHSLMKLWQALRPMMKREGGAHDKDYKAMGKIIAEFAKYDDHSFTFRYAHDTLGASSQERLPESINLAVMHEVMVRVSAFLDAASTYVSERLSTKAEVEVEERAEMEAALRSYEGG